MPPSFLAHGRTAPVATSVGANRQPRRQPPRRAPAPPRAGLRMADNHDPHLRLPPPVRADLDARLGDPGFCAQVSLEAARGAPVEYTGYAFTPVPYGPSTPRGMPPEWEAYAEADSGHVVVNVPPTLPFKAGMGKDGVPGSRVCAIYRVTGAPGSAP